MSNREINYVRALFQSTPNMAFIGLMIFLSLVLWNPGFLFLLAAGEMVTFMLAQAKFVQRFLRARAEREWRHEQEQAEEQVGAGLANNYKADFQKVKELCQEIERRASETAEEKTSGVLIEGLIDKLYCFRIEYVRMLRAHFLLANRNYIEMQRRIQVEIKRVEEMIDAEQSPQVRVTLEQNLKILHQRSTKLRQLDELVRLLEARLQVVRNSLQLIQDEVYSLTNVRGISEMVDGLLVNLELSDEFRSYYDDVLSEQSPMLAGLDLSGEQMNLEPEFTPEPPREQLNKPRRQRKAQ